MIKTFKKGEQEKLSEHFSSDEFDCNCHGKSCTLTYIDTDLIDKLEALRAKWGGHPIKIISGFRCSAHNAKVGGKAGSLHLVGKACDFDYKSLEDIVGVDTMLTDCQQFDGLAISKKDGFIHVDVRGYRARWSYQ